MKKNRRPTGTDSFEEDRHSHAQSRSDSAAGLAGTTPEALVAGKIDGELLRKGMASLSPEFREVVVLRDLEGLSYREIADVADIPIGTVMSRLMRGREALRREILRVHGRGGHSGM